MKLANVAEGFGVDCENAPGHAPATAAIRNTNYYELGLVYPKDAGPHPHRRLFLDAPDANGCMPVPQGPGLGAALDFD